MLADMEEIVEITGCKKPCSYKEYKFTSSTPYEDTQTTTPEDQIFILFWAVARTTQVNTLVTGVTLITTQVEEEVLLYPFLSLIADFGGSLGLFLGFSFITVWQEIKGCFCNY